MSYPSGEVVSLNQFRKMSGQVVAPVHLTDDMSDYVRIVKSDLIDSLREYGITQVRVEHDGEALVFYEGVES